LFDLDGTLRHSRPSFNQAFIEIAIQLGVADRPDYRLKSMRWLHYYWATSPEMLADLELFGERKDLFWTNHARQNLIVFGCSEEQALSLAPQVSRLMSETYLPEDWVSPEVPEVLAELQQAGFTLAVVSNRTNPFEEELERLGLRSYFEFALAAGEIKSWKPQAEIFWHALRRLDVSPQETLYVGDNYYADVVGPQQIGMGAVLIDTDAVFPEAECAVIQSLGDLRRVLEK
jgi:HAD superfamily hydrolase (TIGR01509 family)